MNKNPTPAKIAFGAAALPAVILLTVLFLLDQRFQLIDISLWLVIFIPIIFFVLNYLMLYSTLQYFIYRKIKLIYKRISTNKEMGKMNSINLNEDIIGQIDEQVDVWADEQGQTISSLKKREQFRKEFIGDVSHELKTPIFNIQGYLDTLVEGAVDDPKIKYDYLERASKNVERLIHIVEDLTEISKLETGDLPLEISRFDIYQMALDIFELNERDADAKDIRLEIKEGFFPPIWVSADINKIHQVLMNLVGNAIKYGKDSGLVQLSFYDMDKKYLIEVSDDGIGIDEESLPRLFERFYRVDKSRSRDAGGTGLGLSIVKHIITAHNEQINVRSKKGLGSTFGFTLPAG